MRESMTVTLQQLRENTRMIEQYKVRLQTMKIRIAIEQKVKESYSSAKFEERYQMLENQIRDSTAKQEALQVQVKQIQQGWGEYYSRGISEIKERFEQINSTTIVTYMDQQKVESENLDRELEVIMGEVQQLEIDVQSTDSTQVSSQGATDDDNS